MKNSLKSSTFKLTIIFSLIWGLSLMGVAHAVVNDQNFDALKNIKTANDLKAYNASLKANQLNNAKIKQSTSNYVPHRLIVFLKNSENTADLTSFNALNTKYKVINKRALFAGLTGQANPQALMDKNLIKGNIDLIKSKYAKRSLRISTADQNADLVAGISDAYVLDLDPSVDTQKAMAEYANNTMVKSVQLDIKYNALQVVPNDTLYPQMYDMTLMNMPTAWGKTMGKGIVVAVVDSGVDYNHPDITANILPNPNPTQPGGTGSQTNIQQSPTAPASLNPNNFLGWNFIDNNNNTMDGCGHGTHVAGTIAAVGNNNLGIIGVAPQAKILPVKIFDNNCDEASSSTIAEGILYAVQNGADVISLSLGCASACPSNPVIEGAIHEAHALGVVVVLAAGNSSQNVSLYSPQNMNEVIDVAASDPKDNLAAFSNFGYRVDVTAPAVNVISLSAQGGNNTLLNNFECSKVSDTAGGTTMDPNYMSCSGTSMAAPHVAGLAALILSDNPTFTPEEVRQVIRASADSITEPSFDIEGAGRIDAAKALHYASALQVRLFIPDKIALGKGPVTLTGIAAGTNFASYQLSYAPVSTTAPVTWAPIGPVVTTPVLNGTLGQWNPSSMAPGFYLVRLQAVDTNGTVYNDYAPAVEPSSGITQIATLNQGPYPYEYSSMAIAPIAVDGNNVVWIDSNTAGNSYVYLYNLSTKQTTQISTQGSATAVAISGNNVVWVETQPQIWYTDPVWGDSYYTFPDLFFEYQINNATTVALTNIKNYNGQTQVSVRMSGNQVLITEGWGYSLYNLSSQTYQDILQNNGLLYSDTYGDISGDLVAYQAVNDIYVNGQFSSIEFLPAVYSISTGNANVISITNSQCGKYVYYPEISGNNLIWESNSGQASDQSPVLCTQNLLTGQQTYLGDISSVPVGYLLYNQNGPYNSFSKKSLSNLKIAWINESGYKSMLDIFDIPSQTTTALVPSSLTLYGVAIDQNNLVWMDESGIYAYPIANPALVNVQGQVTYNGAPLTYAPQITVTPSSTSLNITGNGTFMLYNIPEGIYGINVAAQGHSASYTLTVTPQQELYPNIVNITIPLNYPITTSISGEGTISPSGTVYAWNTGSQTFNFTPKSGYMVGQVLVDGQVVASTPVSSYTLTNVTAAHTIAVNFIKTSIPVSTS